MILQAFTVFHVILSLIGIGSGLIVAVGLLSAKFSTGITKLFLLTTAATSITGFMFPFHGVTPGQIVGVISLIVLLFAFLGFYRYHLAGGWRRTYAITAVIALYLNVFVLIVQLFRKVPALEAIAPTQSEPPFQVTQLVVLVIFAAVGIRAAMKSSHLAIRAA